jgi:hypothetical protein
MNSCHSGIRSRKAWVAVNGGLIERKRMHERVHAAAASQVARLKIIVVRLRILRAATNS